MERTTLAAHRWRLVFLGAAAAAVVWLLRDVLRALGMQVLAASLLMLLALPLCRLLEKKLPGGVSAALALILLILFTAGACLLVLPQTVGQLQQLGTALPSLLDSLKGYLLRVTEWMNQHGVDLTALQEGLTSQLTQAAGGLVGRAVSLTTTVLSSLSKVLLSPLLAFYLLRDRRRISAGLTLLLPVNHRARGVRAAREMKRETAAFLRGQLILSLTVGSLTALGLLLTGTPGWLLLGVLMGILELVPYIGPVIAGVPAVLLALQGGWVKALWTLGVLVVIQELEGAVLSPRLVGEATALHPMAVLLLVSAGGMLGGALGMVLVIPAVVSLRGALRGWRE